MSLVNPVIGNDSFQKISNATGHLAELNVSSGQAVDLSAESVTLDLLNQNLAGLGTLRQVVGYAPTSFATAGAADVMFLNNQPQSDDATDVSDSQLLLLPVDARVVSAVVTNNGVTVVGGTNFDVGTEVWSASPAGSADIFDAVVLASVNNGAFVGSLVGASAPVALGSVGKDLSVGSAVAANSGVSVTVNGTPNTAGDLAVTVTYLL